MTSLVSNIRALIAIKGNSSAVQLFSLLLVVLIIHVGALVAESRSAVGRAPDS